MRNYILFFLLILLGCSDKEESLDDNYMQVVQKIVAKIKLDRGIYLDQSFIINPKLNYFEVNSFWKRTLKIEDYDPNHQKLILESLDIQKEEYNLLKKEINNKYYGKMFPYLSNFSTSKSSHTVINFSGFSDKLVFVEIIDFCESISIDELNSTKLLNVQNIKNVDCIPFLINQGAIEATLKGAGYSSENCL